MKVLVILLGLSFATASMAHQWEIDSAHSSASFKVRHMVVANVVGTIGGITGTLFFDKKNPESAKVSATLDATSIDTKDKKRDDHLKTNDFLNVKNFPKISFVSKKVRVRGKDRLAVTGDLTIREVTKTVVLEVEGFAGEVKDSWGNIRKGFSATTTIDRKQFGVDFHKTLDGGGLVVSDQVQISLEVGVRRRPKSL